MWAWDGSIQTCSPLGNNNQQGGEGASQTSDNAAKNQSPLTGCCCKPVRAPAGVVPTEPSYHAPACQSCGTASGESILPVHYTECGMHDPGSRNCAIFVLYTVSIVPSFTSRV